MIKNIAYKALRAWYEFRGSLGVSSSKPRRGSAARETVGSLDELEAIHFGSYTDRDHPCKATLMLALRELHGKPSVIVETGSSAWGTNSSMLFDLYVANFGGSFNSVDLRAEPSLTLSRKCSNRSRFWRGDSVNWLNGLSSVGIPAPDLVYLDSWDVNPVRPIESAIHGLAEFLQLLPFLRKGSLVLIDDTPCNHEVALKVQGCHFASEWLESSRKYLFNPGKGALVKQYIESNSIGSILAHEYQLLIRI